MKSSSFCLAALVILTATSCKKESEQIKTYSVAKETPPPQAPAADPHAGMPGGMMPGGAMPGTADGKDPHAGVPGMGGGADPHAGLPGMGGSAPSVEVKDSPPAHWEKRPGSGMRVASYFIKSEDGAAAAVSLSNLRAAPASKFNAFNMWREQLGQPVADEAALQQLPSAKTGFGDGVLVDVEGVPPSVKDAKPSRLVGVIVEDKGTAWYFKMVGDAAVVAKERDAFILWASTVKVGEPSKVPMHGTKPGEGMATPAAAPAAAAPAGDGSVTWTLPEGWTIGNGSSARYATIAVAGADGTKGEVAISHFPGDVGGDLANVNRWRQQVALPPIDEAALAPLVSKVTSGPKTMSLIDVTGPQTRCAAGWTRHGADTWFFKFTGPDTLVGAEKAKFTAFLESVRFTKPE